MQEILLIIRRQSSSLLFPEGMISLVDYSFDTNRTSFPSLVLGSDGIKTIRQIYIKVSIRAYYQSNIH